MSKILEAVQRYIDENTIVSDEVHNISQIVVDTACAICIYKQKKTLNLIFAL